MSICCIWQKRGSDAPSFKLQSEAVDPGGKLLCGNGATHDSAFFDYGAVGYAATELAYGFAEAAAAGGGKQNDCLAGEVVLFQESVDDGRCNIPPDGEADENNIVIGKVFALALNFGMRQLRSPFL